MSLQPYYDTFKEMPLILKWIFSLCVAGIAFTIGPAIPLIDFNLNGKIVNQIEFWRSGAGPLMVLSGIIMIITGYGIIQRARWSRLLFLSIIPFQAIFSTTIGLYTFEQTKIMLIQYLIFFLPLFGWYLLKKKNVQDFFER